MPTAPELPKQGSGGANSSDSESSSSSPAVDQRKTKSEPPNSPRELPASSGPEGLPAHGRDEAASEEPGPPAAAEAGGNEVEEAVEVEVNSSGPSGLLTQGMNGSWIALSQAPTEKSFTLPDPDEL